MADGRTALHLAAARGSTQIVRFLLDKSAANEEEENQRLNKRRKVHKAGSVAQTQGEVRGLELSGTQETNKSETESDGEMVDDDESDDDARSGTTGSFVKVNKDEENSKSEETLSLDDNLADPDFYNIDVVSWDSRCSALHYAILGGHTEVVKVLSWQFGADLLNPVKFGDGSDLGPRAAILTLVLALTLPVDKAVEMARALLTLGATSSQADVSGVTVFHRYVQHGIPKLVEFLLENDKVGLKTAINHIVVSGNKWNKISTSPLMTAIDGGDPVLVLRLLKAGANPQPDFDSWLKAAKLTIEGDLSDYESNLKKFKSSIEPPLILAIRSAHPALALELLRLGADPNVITKDSQNLLTKVRFQHYTKGLAAIDVVSSCLNSLRKYSGEKTNFRFNYGTNGLYLYWNNTYSHVPEAPQGADSVLARFKEGTYQHWVVASDIKSKLDSYDQEVKLFDEKHQKLLTGKGVKEKIEAIANIISQLEEVEKALVARGALTFKQQYPDIPAPPERSDPIQPEPSRVYDFQFVVQDVADVTESRKEAYTEL